MSALVAECHAIGETSHAVVKSTSTKHALQKRRSQLAVRLHAALVRQNAAILKTAEENKAMAKDLAIALDPESNKIALRTVEVLFTVLAKRVP